MKRLISLTLITIFLTACSSFSSRMQDLSFGMTESQVRSELGSDYTVVASALNKDGKQVSGWRYQDSDKDPAYMVYFVNGKLAQWGEASALKAIPELGDPDANSK